MTATSGPGFSLMMENLGLGIMLRRPVFSGQCPARRPIHRPADLVGQQDMMQDSLGLPR